MAGMPGQQEPPPPPLPGGTPTTSGGSSGSSGSTGGYGNSSAPSSSSSSPPTNSAGAAKPTTLDANRGARFMSMGFESIAKLRAEATKYDKMAGKERHKASKLTTSMEKHRHVATVKREKEQATLGKIPDLEASMGEQQKMLQMQASGTTTGEVRMRDQSKIRVRIRKIQQKMASLQRRAKNLEHAAATHMQKASHLKVLADMHLEKAKEWETESQQYTLLADRMAKATEPETIAPTLGH